MAFAPASPRAGGNETSALVDASYGHQGVRMGIEDSQRPCRRQEAGEEGSDASSCIILWYGRQARPVRRRSGRSRCDSSACFGYNHLVKRVSKGDAVKKKLAKAKAPKPAVRKRRPPPKSAAENADPRPVVLGLLPTPPEVLEQIERDLKGRPVSVAARQRMIDCYNMQYHCGGKNIAYRNTPQGVEVLAVGLENVGKFFRERPPEDDSYVIRDCPDPW